MTMTSALNLSAVLPEILLALSGMALLMFGVFSKGDATRPVGWAAVIAFVVAGVLVLTGAPDQLVFGGSFIVDSFAVFSKVLILAGAALTLIMAIQWLEAEKIGRFEFAIVLLFGTTGMLMMVSANDLMSLYLGLELQSLAAYVVAAFNRDNLRSTEAGLKYFVLGSVASGLLLFGMSFVYGFAGTTTFIGIAEGLSHGHASTGILVGVVFMLAGLSFKISAAPFHMWTPDVYEGAPTPVTAFFAIAPKVAALALMARVLLGPFEAMADQWQQVVWFVSVLSMFIGGFAAITQTNIKRLMAYSSIGHVGYALIGLAVADQEGVRGMLIYLAIYLFMNVGTFAVILSMRQKGRATENISDLAGLSKTHPMMALWLAVFMFSMAGIPPLAGFFGKLYVFLAAIQAEMYGLAVIGVLTSVVSAFYYIRIIKVMYFDEPVEAFDRPTKATSAILGLCGLFVTLFILYPAPILGAAEAAAASLFSAG
ncbi:MAG: NADH-quinone oxidoreductase subunit NuoN [Caenispirillum bisanense]|nr:NADH-quinone oxidoreductase subunit NuoN [Caenispirillum bisanense]MCA1971845.1 NADH-quinone oxidoreductase subunit NuoN [Caenispirillum sp.]